MKKKFELFYKNGFYSFFFFENLAFDSKLNRPQLQIWYLSTVNKGQLSNLLTFISVYNTSLNNYQ